MHEVHSLLPVDSLPYPQYNRKTYPQQANDLTLSTPFHLAGHAQESYAY